MKKILFIAVAVSIAFAACKKDNDAQPQKLKIEKKTMDGEDGGDDGKNSGDGPWG